MNTSRKSEEQDLEILNAAKNNDWEAVNRGLNQGISNIDVTFDYPNPDIGKTILWYAAKHQQWLWVHRLYNMYPKINVNAYQPNPAYGEGSYLEVCSTSHILYYQNQPQYEDSEYTPLQFAIYHKQFFTAALLISRKATIRRYGDIPEASAQSLYHLNTLQRIYKKRFLEHFKKSHIQHAAAGFLASLGKLPLDLDVSIAGFINFHESNILAQISKVANRLARQAYTTELDTEQVIDSNYNSKLPAITLLTSNLFAHVRQQENWSPQPGGDISDSVAVVDTVAGMEIEVLPHPKVTHIASMSDEYFATISCENIIIWDTTNFSEQAKVSCPQISDAKSSIILSVIFQDPYFYVLRNDKVNKQKYYSLWNFNIATQQGFFQIIQKELLSENGDRCLEAITPRQNFILDNHYVVANENFMRFFNLPLDMNALTNSFDKFFEETKADVVFRWSNNSLLVTHNIKSKQLTIWQIHSDFKLEEIKKIHHVSRVSNRLLPNDHLIYCDNIGIQSLNPRNFSSTVCVTYNDSNPEVSAIQVMDNGRIATHHKYSSAFFLYGLKNHSGRANNVFFKQKVSLEGLKVSPQSTDSTHPVP